jgi:hypothetical protein
MTFTPTFTRPATPFPEETKVLDGKTEDFVFLVKNAPDTPFKKKISELGYSYATDIATCVQQGFKLCADATCTTLLPKETNITFEGDTKLKGTTFPDPLLTLPVNSTTG